jgi:hypothetical protein
MNLFPKTVKPLYQVLLAALVLPGWFGSTVSHGESLPRESQTVQSIGTLTGQQQRDALITRTPLFLGSLQQHNLRQQSWAIVQTGYHWTLHKKSSNPFQRFAASSAFRLLFLTQKGVRAPPAKNAPINSIEI